MVDSHGAGFEQEQEEFFTVKWSIDERTGAPLLLAAGLEGVCRVLDCNTQDLVWASPCFPPFPVVLNPSCLSTPFGIRNGRKSVGTAQLFVQMHCFA
jgi:hypothetical protein